jgi:hypothetical protein
MTATLQRILFAIAAGLIAVDLVWGIAGHFQLDSMAYLRLGLLALALTGAGHFYQIRRNEPSIAAMLMGASFLCAFSAAASMLNYFLLTLHGPRIDAELAAADRALGFDWVGVMTIMAGHPRLNTLLALSYNMVLPEIALFVVLLGWNGKAQKIYRFCLAIALGALACIFVWALMPSFGAMSIYRLPPAVARAVAASVDDTYGSALVAMLRNGPGFISPSDIRGLIGFPSYHAVLALIAICYARSLPHLFWPLLALNILVLVATPVQGGHHLMDVLASFPIAALVVFLSSFPVKAKEPAKTSDMVNKLSKWPMKPRSLPRFPFMPAKD